VHILLCFLALSAGTLIYVFYRKGPPVFTTWPVFSFIPDYSTDKSLSWLIYSLPDLLWSFAYSVLITGLWWNHPGKLKYMWLGSIPLVVCGFELMQLFRLIPGTFSIPDLLSVFTGMISGFLIAIKPFKSKYHEKTIT
jgi:hypothetical protein